MLGQLCCILLMLTQYGQVTWGEEKLNLSKIPSFPESGNVNFSVPAEALAHIFNTSTTKDMTHEGREIVFSMPKATNTTSSIVESTSITSSIKEPTPTYDVMSEKNDFKTVVAKKGAVFETPTTPMNTTMIPQMTKVAPSTVYPLNKTAKSPEVHINMEETIATSNIMLPIVAIVVSVPLLGLLVVGFYKCGSEWWQHRHYRRMDFLIDGMYNN